MKKVYYATDTHTVDYEDRYTVGKHIVWEHGGGWSNGGAATVIALQDGSEPTPFLINTDPRPNCHHAAIIAAVGMYIIEAEHADNTHYVRVFQITGLEDTAECVVVVNAVGGTEEIMERIPDHLRRAVLAAVRKAHCQQCTDLHYVKADGNKKEGVPPPS